MLSLFIGFGMIGLIFVIVHEYRKQRQKAAKERELKAVIMDEEIAGLEEEIDRKRKGAARRRTKLAKEEEEKK